MARLGSVCTNCAAQTSRRNASSAAVALKIRTSRPRTAAANGLNASAGASTMKKWIPRASPRLHHRGRDLSRRRHADPLEGELGLQHARERLRLLEADLCTGKGALAALEHQAPIARDRLVAGIAGDFDIADGDALRRRG